MLILDELPKEKVYSLLPEAFLDNMKDVVSAKGIIWLIENHGGTEIVIPKSQITAKRSFSGLSDDDIKKLCSVCAGCRLEIPRGAKLTRFIRDCRIIQARKSGMSCPVIAREFGMSTRNIRKILNRPSEYHFQANPSNQLIRSTK